MMIEKRMRRAMNKTITRVSLEGVLKEEIQMWILEGDGRWRQKRWICRMKDVT